MGEFIAGIIFGLFIGIWFALGMTVDVWQSGKQAQSIKAECELNLPRSQTCTIIAIKPEDNLVKGNNQ